MSRAMKSVATA